MDVIEAQSAVKSIYLLSASMAGLGVSPDSPEELANMVAKGYSLVEISRRPEAVANLLRIVATTLEMSQQKNELFLHESSVRRAQDSVCPVYPFNKREIEHEIEIEYEEER